MTASLFVFLAPLGPLLLAITLVIGQYCKLVELRNWRWRRASLSLSPVSLRRSVARAR
jgi:hypothetical protein